MPLRSSITSKMATFVLCEKDIVLKDNGESAEAKWFDVNNLPNSPKPGSIAYRLIHGEY